MYKTESAKQLSPEMERIAAQRARDRAQSARWNLDVAVFLFAILILVIILGFQGFGIEYVAPIAVFGLTMVWLMGWNRGRQLYPRLYEEELAKLEQELKKTIKGMVEETVEDTIEEKILKELHKRWKY
ncbi:MAG: hypothetical protein PHN78_03820 [Dehalococcoidales bacterium]|nr:hypothetical protein [Dehalococcoidales bacterium]